MTAILGPMLDGTPLLWIESTAYSEKLLAGGSAPWADVAQLINWIGRGQALLKSDVVTLPVMPIVEAWLSSHPDLGRAMAEKSRPSFALRILLSDEPLRKFVASVTAGLAATLATAPLVLRLPDAGQWLVDAHRHATGNALIPDEDFAEDGAAYVADWLRSLSDGVGGLLVEGAGGTALAPVHNVAGYYGWKVGTFGSSGDFAIAAAPVVGITTIVEAPFDGAVPEARARYVAIPPDAQPELVLAKLDQLRS